MKLFHPITGDQAHLVALEDPKDKASGHDLWQVNLPLPNITPPPSKALFRAYEPLLSLNKADSGRPLRPYFRGGVHGRGAAPVDQQ